MHEVDLVLALLVAVAVLAVLGRRLTLPAPMLLVLGGLVLALVPGLPRVQLAPELAFLLFLPPLLYLAAYDTSIREIRLHARSIVSLALGLVLATTLAVAVLVHVLLPELGWPAAFALGAIVSPPDAVAAAAVFRGLGVPRRLVTILESESLFNDAAALVLYEAAIGALFTTFSPTAAGLRFLAVGFGGLPVGLLVGRTAAWLRGRLDDPPVEITLSLLTPFAAYIPAERLGVSGVLATVTAGLCVGWWSPRIMESETRLRGRAVWDLVSFVLNGLVFLLIGLQLSTILQALASRPPLTLLALGLLISLAVILLRLAWVFGDAFVMARLRHDPDPAAGEARPAEALVVGWAGMRGVISLATALALPTETPDRELLLFLTFCVILATLVGQGLSLPWLVRTLGVTDDGSQALHQELQARAVAADAAVRRIERLAAEWPTHQPLIETLRAQYAHRMTHLEPSPAEHGDGDEQAAVDAAEQELVEHRQIRRSVIDAERRAVLALRQRGEIADESWRRIERDLDYEELRLEA